MFQEYGDSYVIDQLRHHMKSVITPILKPLPLFPWLRLICRITEGRHGLGRGHLDLFRKGNGIDSCLCTGVAETGRSNEKKQEKENGRGDSGRKLKLRAISRVVWKLNAVEAS